MVAEPKAATSRDAVLLPDGPLLDVRRPWGAGPVGLDAADIAPDAAAYRAAAADESAPAAADAVRPLEAVDRRGLNRAGVVRLVRQDAADQGFQVAPTACLGLPSPATPVSLAVAQADAAPDVPPGG